MGKLTLFASTDKVDWYCNEQGEFWQLNHYKKGDAWKKIKPKKQGSALNPYVTVRWDKHYIQSMSCKRTIAQCFIKGYDNSPIRFKDGNQENLSVDNLEVYSLGEAIKEAKAKTPKQAYIVTDLQTGITKTCSNNELAKIVGISSTSIPSMVSYSIRHNHPYKNRYTFKRRINND